MAFVSEYISEEDYVKYGLAQVDSANVPPFMPAPRLKGRDWTIDRERNAYLRHYSASRFPEDENFDGWTFYWQGELFWFLSDGIDSKQGSNGSLWLHARIRKLKIPPNLRQHQEQILSDLRDAFQTYAGGGVFNTVTEFSQKIDIELE